MRRVMLGLLTAVAFTIAAPERVATPLSLAVFAAAQQPAEPPPAAPEQAPAPSARPQQPAQRDQIDINVNQQPTSGVIWYRSPIWIAIGSIAVVLFAVVVIMMTRGGTGSTVTSER